jgi:hypothetical protein
MSTIWGMPQAGLMLLSGENNKTAERQYKLNNTSTAKLALKLVATTLHRTFRL